MWSLFHFAALLLHCYFVSANTVVKTPNVQYTGILVNETESFLGIPFAENVGGTKRFTKAVAKRWSPGSIFNAIQPGAACPQALVPYPDFPLFSNVTNSAEDCLNLRVDRPANTPINAKLPVMVWIYGGQ